MIQPTDELVEATCGNAATLRYFAADRLTRRQVDAWRSFAAEVPSAHYLQDPAWATVELQGSRTGVRRPFFLWVERGGVVCLTALGVRRRLPVPGQTFWEFNRGPNFVDADVFDEWLAWLVGHRSRGVARLRLQPPLPLAQGGDDVETMLERHGLVRRRILGGWATLTVDLGPGEDDIRRSFRSATQRSIKKSLRLGIEVCHEDTPQGWSALSRLESDVAQRSPVGEVDESEIASISRNWLRQGQGGTILVARHGGEPLAAALLVVYGEKAYLPLTPSSSRHRELPASHLMVFEAARWAKSRGCSSLDLVGYSMMARPGDGLWGINQFKRGFAASDRLTRFTAIHERVFSPTVVTAAAAARRSQAWLHRARGGRDA